MNVRVRLFAILRERAGRESIEVEVADDATVADAIEALGEQPGLGEVLERMPVAMAVNREYAPAETPLRSGDELALIPPVSGGAEPEVRATVTEAPLSIERLSRAVGRPQAGAIVSFQGTTRDVERLDYEAYSEMAEGRIAAILHECAERHGLCAAAAAHRIGSVPRGEASVIVAVSAPHRAEAFAGAREAIDRIKAEAPIWKREVEVGGQERWVEGRAAPGGSIPPARERTR
jgi:molybdopterin synthase catalytic subunit